VLFGLSRTKLGLTANNFEDSIACTISREIYDSRTQATRPHQATKPSWRMGRIIETPRGRERKGERECACPRFYHPRKAYKLTPSWRTLNDDARPCNSRRIYSKLTGDSTRLREVSCWIYLGFEPTTSELSTVFTVEEVGNVPNYRECLTSPRALKEQTEMKKKRRAK